MQLSIHAKKLHIELEDVESKSTGKYQVLRIQGITRSKETLTLVIISYDEKFELTHDLPTSDPPPDDPTK